VTYRVFVVGLDGATFDLIGPWAQAGHLPNLRHLMAVGAWGELRTTIPPMTGPAWTSFMTGQNPGRHGIYDWIARRPDSYDMVPLSARQRQARSLWSIASDAGRRVFALNVPMTYPPEPINGTLIAGLPAVVPRADIAYPTTAYDEITELVGDYILYPDPGQAYSDSGIDAFLKRLYHCTEERIRILEHFRAQEAWDLAMVVFNGTDAIQHALWKFMDPSHPLYDPRRGAKYGAAIRLFYQRMDAWLGEVLEELDDDTLLMVMSDHGAGPFHKFIHVNNWLLDTGFLKLKSTPAARVKRLLFRLGFTPMQAYNLLMRLGLGVFKREVVRGHGQGLLKALFLSFGDVDWERTQAYSLGNVGQIFLNLRGREPAGAVDPADYDRVRDDIVARLADLQDPETGKRVVDNVYRREEVYHGPRLDRAPDVVFLPRNLEYFGFGEYEFGSNQTIEPVARGISGTHRMNGVLLLAGNPVQAGWSIQGAEITDLAPTILHLLGVPVPAEMDGRILSQALIGVVQPAEQPVTLPPSDGLRAPQTDAGDPTDEDDGFSAEDEAAVMERLRNLGYVG
jgi:predicted AlkP superfamily phosphohydrolase/phosphomutase